MTRINYVSWNRNTSTLRFVSTTGARQYQVTQRRGAYLASDLEKAGWTRKQVYEPGAWNWHVVKFYRPMP